jgi:hypothetical protein
MLAARLLLLTLVCSSQASAQVRTDGANDAAAFEGVLVAIRDFGETDVQWQLDSVFAISHTGTTLESYANDSSIVRRALGPSGRIGLSARPADKCPLNREGEPINGCERSGGLQTFFLSGRVGGVDGKNGSAMFVVSISRVGPYADPSSHEGSSWLFRMVRGPDGKYRLRDRPWHLIH